MNAHKLASDIIDKLEKAGVIFAGHPSEAWVGVIATMIDEAERATDDEPAFEDGHEGEYDVDEPI